MVDECVIHGVTTHHIPFPRDVYEHKRSISGDITTTFIEGSIRILKEEAEELKKKDIK
jgi:pyruvate carboxylase